MIHRTILTHRCILARRFILAARKTLMFATGSCANRDVTKTILETESAIADLEASLRELRATQPDPKEEGKV